MTTFQPTKGLLAGIALEEWEAQDLANAADSQVRNKIERITFYKSELRRKNFRGISFSECNFAKSKFEQVTFRKCTFAKVDFTRTSFVDCTFSECRFVNCDPYYAAFNKCAVNPSEFKECYSQDSDWNKALILFSNLREDLEKEGNGRMARIAEYYYRVWERRRLYRLWKVNETSSFWPWFRNFTVAALTGYGERPMYLGSWMLVLVTLMAFVYLKWFPYALASNQNGFTDYWYFSFKVFCAQGFTSEPMSLGLLSCQVLEFAIGLVLVALLVGSVTRKLSS